MPILKIQNLFFSYPGKPLFSSFSLEVQEGERVALLGRSGVGKTTLFRLITGLLQPDQGQIEVAPFSYLMQDTLLLPWKSVLENVLTFSHDVERAHALIRAAKLQAEEKPCQLSGGMKQRVSLIRALLMNKPLLLLDEPFSSLDQETKEVMIALLRSSVTTLFFITHDEREAKALDCRLLTLV